MVKAFITGHYICHTTNILNYAFWIVHWSQASLSFIFLMEMFISLSSLFCCNHNIMSFIICQYYFYNFIKLILFCLFWIVWIFSVCSSVIWIAPFISLLVYSDCWYIENFSCSIPANFRIFLKKRGF